MEVLNNIKQSALLNLKNIPGWKTKRKLVVFVVDDYGNVRVDSKKARENMDKAGLKIYSRFDANDALENREDLLQLYDVLSSVKDKNGNHAVFSPMALPCNINFEKMAEESYSEYIYETLPETFSKLEVMQPEAYSGMMELWNDGIRNKLLAPQFHGREHLNLRILRENLAGKDKATLTALKNRSYTSISQPKYTAAFAYRDKEDTKGFSEIIRTGIQHFKEVYSYEPVFFTPPAQQFPAFLIPALTDFNIRMFDRPLLQKMNSGKGRLKRTINSTGKRRTNEPVTHVRNIVFEPTNNKGIDWTAFTLRQIEAAFRWNKPAVISSHRVNFSGHIDPENRKKGIASLKELLKKITNKWPDAEFISAGELCELILNR